MIQRMWAACWSRNSAYTMSVPCVCHACTDDLTYVGGMLVTLQSLLERIEQLHQEKVEVSDEKSGHTPLASKFILLSALPQSVCLMRIFCSSAPDVGSCLCMQDANPAYF
eukprot:692540-Pelagomonas_calceolata.AAC.3